MGRHTITKKMVRAFAVLALSAFSVSAQSVELTPDNFEEQVMGGKNAFVKFQAPW